MLFVAVMVSAWGTVLAALAGRVSCQWPALSVVAVAEASLKLAVICSPASAQPHSRIGLPC